jgi:TPR repeat protein
MIQLAQIYQKGEEVDKNISEAIRLYQMAIEFNDSFAMNRLAQIYQKGDAIEKNISEAIRLC